MLFCHSSWKGFPQFYVNKDFFLLVIIVHAFPVQNNRSAFHIYQQILLMYFFCYHDIDIFST